MFKFIALALASPQAEIFFFTAIPNQDETRPRTHFDETADYPPIAHVGKTIDLID